MHFWSPRGAWQMTGPGPAIAVVVPSYRRPELLRRCLGALAAQAVQPDDIVVVLRPDDAETAEIVAGWPRVRGVHVQETGVVAALRTGIAATTADVIAFTDDDAAPRPDWIAALRNHLDDATIGAIGGRDLVDYPGEDGPLTELVGVMKGWGRVVGHHHLGCGPPRDVDVLKGVNMAFRRSALAMPMSLRGAGAQVDWELACCLWATNRGWRLVYDPCVVVDHAVGPRVDAGPRHKLDARAISDAAYNRLAILLTLRPRVGAQRCGFGIAVGDRTAPGLLRAAVALARRENGVAASLLPSLRGQFAALIDAIFRRRVQMSAAAAEPAQKISLNRPA
jgi:glycosyltransferase involved in cell wall biosynthesis